MANENSVTSFDARLARARARAENARADVDRIERWLRESDDGTRVASRARAGEDTREGEPSASFSTQLSPVRSSIHRPIPRRALSASVDGTAWSTRRISSTFGAFGGDAREMVREEGVSAFQHLPAAPVRQPELSDLGEGTGDWNTPPGTPLRPQPRTPPRRSWRTRSEDFTGLPMGGFTSIDVGTSRASTSSLLESVANEAELERLRSSGVDFKSIQK